MQITKHLEKKLLKDYFLIEGKLQVNSKYFIDRINKGVTEEGNLSHRTNLTDKMTSFNFFNQDIYFIELMRELIDWVDCNIKMKNYKLHESWGFCSNKGSKTISHDHSQSLWSGVIFLNDHSQTLDFDEIKESIRPLEGKFVIFSSFLNHGCERSIENYAKYGISFNFNERHNW